MSCCSCGEKLESTLSKQIYFKKMNYNSMLQQCWYSLKSISQKVYLVQTHWCKKYSYENFKCVFHQGFIKSWGSKYTNFTQRHIPSPWKHASYENSILGMSGTYQVHPRSTQYVKYNRGYHTIHTRPNIWHSLQLGRPICTSYIRDSHEYPCFCEFFSCGNKKHLKLIVFPLASRTMYLLLNFSNQDINKSLTLCVESLGLVVQAMEMEKNLDTQALRCSSRAHGSCTRY